MKLINLNPDRTERWAMFAVLINIFALLLLYANNDELRVHAGYTFRKILGILKKLDVWVFNPYCI